MHLMQNKLKIEVKLSFFKLKGFRKTENMKSIEVAKIDVLFDNANMRLITFHSEDES